MNLRRNYSRKCRRKKTHSAKISAIFCESSKPIRDILQNGAKDCRNIQTYLRSLGASPKSEISWSPNLDLSKRINVNSKIMQRINNIVAAKTVHRTSKKRKRVRKCQSAHRKIYEKSKHKWREENTMKDNEIFRRPAEVQTWTSASTEPQCRFSSIVSILSYFRQFSMIIVG